MKRIPLLLFCSIAFASSIHAQRDSLPDWFLNDLEANVGTWIADNAAFQNEKEPFSHYGIEWTWGIGKTSIKGRLFGIQDSVETVFWEFRQYWDNENKQAKVVQYGNWGMIGEGVLKSSGDKIESIQTFSVPSGMQWEERHLSTISDTLLISTSFDLKEEKWQEKRTYHWKKQV